MSRPTTKEDLIKIAQENYQKLQALIGSFSPAEQELNFKFEDRDKNIKDVLIHLFEWHQLLLNWEKSNLIGKEKSFLEEGYNWKTYPAMNIKFWEKHQNTHLNEAKEMLAKSHQAVIIMIDSHSNDELFSKFYPWTLGSTLDAYCTSATSSHYDWAIKKIKKQKKALNTN